MTLKYTFRRKSDELFWKSARLNGNQSYLVAYYCSVKWRFISIDWENFYFSVTIYSNHKIKLKAFIGAFAPNSSSLLQYEGIIGKSFS